MNPVQKRIKDPTVKKVSQILIDKAEARTEVIECQRLSY
jgi:hypothetical protein